ncbi:MAG: hypothetical protein H7Y17_16175 [Chlorobia bacterium]|nr:hypothetical protein [Fimbriimonadaceae bacterium]
MVGQEFGKPWPCWITDSEWVVVDFSANGKPFNPNGSDLWASVRSPDGYEQPVRSGRIRGSMGFFAVQKGFDPKVPFLDLMIRQVGKVKRDLPAIRLEKFTRPALAIQASEQRMKGPRWKVTQIQNAIEVEVVNPKPGLVSAISLLRSTFLLYLSDAGPRNYTPQGNTVQSSMVESGSREVELEETLFKVNEDTEYIHVKGISIEEEFGSPVLNVAKPIAVTSSSGIMVEIPAQRLKRYRQATGSVKEVELKMSIRHLRQERQGHEGLKIDTASFQLLGIEPDLGQFGIGVLKFPHTMGSQLGTSSLPFVPSGSKTGKADWKFKLSVRTLQPVDHFKGIVPITKS